MKKLLLIIFNPKFPIHQLFMSVIVSILTQIFLLSTYYSIDNFEYSYEFLFEILGKSIFYVVIANVLPYLFIKLKMVSSDCVPAFIRHYFKAVMICSVFIMFMVLLDGGIVHINAVMVFFLPTSVAFMLFKKFSK